MFEVYIVVRGEEYIPESFGTKVEAEHFANECEDYVSGPWVVCVERPTHKA